MLLRCEIAWELGTLREAYAGACIVPRVAQPCRRVFFNQIALQWKSQVGFVVESAWGVYRRWAQLGME